MTENVITVKNWSDVAKDTEIPKLGDVITIDLIDRDGNPITQTVRITDIKPSAK